MKRAGLIFFMCWMSAVYAQNRDSLNSVLMSGELSDSLRAETLLKVADINLLSNPKQSVSDAEEAVRLAQSASLKQLHSRALNVLGTANLNSGNGKKAEELFHHCINLSLQIDDNKLLSYAYNNLSNICHNEGNYEKGLKNLYMALFYLKRINDSSGIATVYLNIANNFLLRQENTIGSAFLHKALEYAKNSKKADLKAAIYGSLGIIEAYAKNSTKAGYYLKLSETEYRSIGDNFHLNDLYNNLCYYYLDLDNNEKVRYYANKILHNNPLADSANKTAAFINIAASYNNESINEAHQDTKLLLMSIAYLDSAFTLANQAGFQQDLLEVYNRKATIYNKLKRNDSAYRYSVLYNKLFENILSEKKEKTINDLKIKYEVNEKEKENLLLSQTTKLQEYELKQNKIYLLVILALFALACVFVFLFIRQNKLKTKQQNLELEQKLLRSQMNPHFIFNALIAIESFIYKNEPKEAGKYLSDFARLMRLILENSREEYVALEKEITTIEYYLNLQQLRYNNSFSYSILLDDSVQTSAIAIPPMLAQPFIENSIEHGFKRSSTLGKIHIRFSLQDGMLLFEVTDNGIGFQKSNELKDKNSTHTSLAGIITAERLSNLNKRTRKKISFSISEVRNEQNSIIGSRVSFMVPYITY